MQILIIDDFRDAVAALVRVLEVLGHEVRGAHTGREGLALADERAFDLGLFDLELPDLSGYELARTIRRRPGGTRPFLVAVTGWDDHEHERDALAAGFDRHVVKPIDAPRLAEVVRDASAVLSSRDATRAG